jgi:hypothetical protein
MRLPWFIGAVTALALFPAISHAQRPINLQARTAGELAALCGAKPGNSRAAAEITFCHGFAQGVVDLLLGTAGPTKPFCFPNPPPTRTATLAQFVDWVRSVPEHAQLPAAKGLAQFLGERFPCK